MVKIRHIKKIIELSKMPTKKLRKLNEELERAYCGEELTREQLIYQITFLSDAPNVEG